MKTIAIEYSTSGRNKVIDIGPLHLVYTVHRVHIEYSRSYRHKVIDIGPLHLVYTVNRVHIEYLTSGRNKVLDIGPHHLICKSIEEKYLVDEISMIFFFEGGGRIKFGEENSGRCLSKNFKLQYITNSIYC